MAGLNTFCGRYRIEWLNKAGEVVKAYEKALTLPLYNKEVMEMQTAYLRGMDVVELKAIPLN
jgi:hypothetical protein